MYTPRYKEKYQNEVLPALKEQFGFKSVMRVPESPRSASTKALANSASPTRNSSTLASKR